MAESTVGSSGGLQTQDRWGRNSFTLRPTTLGSRVSEPYAGNCRTYATNGRTFHGGFSSGSAGFYGNSSICWSDNWTDSGGVLTQYSSTASARSYTLANDTCSEVGRVVPLDTCVSSTSSGGFTGQSADLNSIAHGIIYYHSDVA